MDCFDYDDLIEEYYTKPSRGRKSKFLGQYDRLHEAYPYYLPNGFPDLLYNERTSAYECDLCCGAGCGRCFNTGYVFLDTTKRKAQAQKLSERKRPYMGKWWGDL